MFDLLCERICDLINFTATCIIVEYLSLVTGFYEAANFRSSN